MIKLPIFIVDGNDIHMYFSIQQAISDVESVDVNDYIFEIYDGHGNVLNLVSKPKKIKLMFGQETLEEVLDIEESTAKQNQRDKLMCVIKNYLVHMRKDKQYSDDWSFDALVTELGNVFRAAR